MKNYIRIIQLKAMKKSTELLMRLNPTLDFEELGQYMSNYEVRARTK